LSAGESVPPVAERAPAGSPQGSLLAIGGGVAFGTLGIFGTLFYDHGGDSFALLVLRFCGASVLLGAIALLKQRRVRPHRSDVALAAAAGIGLLGATFCLFAGYKEASPGLVTLLFYVFPLLVTIGDRVLFGVVLGRRRALILVAGLAGIALTVGVPDSATGAAVLWGLAAGVLTTSFILLSRHVMARSLEPFSFVAIEFSGAAVLVLIITAVVGMDWPPSSALPSALGVIVIGSVVPVLLFYSAIRLIGAGTAARLATVEPVTAVILSYVVLGDSLAVSQIIGGAIVVASVVALAKA
jgi:drug/metabolite transporter (DMT)-like permease